MGVELKLDIGSGLVVSGSEVANGLEASQTWRSRSLYTFLGKHQPSYKHYRHWSFLSILPSWKRGILPSSWGRERTRESLNTIISVTSPMFGGFVAIPQTTPLLAQNPDHSAQLLVLNLVSPWSMGTCYSSCLSSGQPSWIPPPHICSLLASEPWRHLRIWKKLLLWYSGWVWIPHSPLTDKWSWSS